MIFGRWGPGFSAQCRIQPGFRLPRFRRVGIAKPELLQRGSRLRQSILPNVALGQVPQGQRSRRVLIRKRHSPLQPVHRPEAHIGAIPGFACSVGSLGNQARIRHDLGNRLQQFGRLDRFVLLQQRFPDPEAEIVVEHRHVRLDNTQKFRRLDRLPLDPQDAQHHPGPLGPDRGRIELHHRPQLVDLQHHRLIALNGRSRTFIERHGGTETIFRGDAGCRGNRQGAR